MTEYYPYLFEFNQKKYYCIWHSNGKDGFITELNKIKSFGHYDKLWDYANENNINFKEECVGVKVDVAIVWLEKENKKVDCEYFLNYWNIISDLANSVGADFYGNSEKDIICTLYNKMFFGNNVPALKGDGEEFVPIWNEEEINELIKVVTDGIRIVKDYLE